MNTDADQPQKPNALPINAMFRMITGYQITQMIYAAVKLGIADLLADGAKTSAELAQATQTNASALYRLLRALASVGIFAEDEQARFGLTPLAQLLRTGVPGSLRASALWHGDPVNGQIWNDLTYSVTTGESAISHILGVSHWDYMTRHPDLNMLFNTMFTGYTVMEIAAVVSAYDFSHINTLVDVGGGQGGLMAAILKANPDMQGTVFDQSHVISGTMAVLDAAGVAARCKLVVGDFFASLPIGADAYLFKYILHDWDDDSCVAILTTCHRAMKPDAKVIVVDYMIPTGNDPHPGKILDIAMLVRFTGHERTETEFRTLFDKAGLKLTNIIPTDADMSIIEAIPE
jgi:hypothetical protein